jgi:hypothetical protein
MAGLGFVYLGTIVEGGPAFRWAIPALVQGLELSAAVSVPVLVVAATRGAQIDRFLTRAHAAILSPSPRRFATGVAILGFGLAAFFTWFCFHGDLYTGDEFSQGFQIRLLLHGRLTAVPEQYREFFNTGETFDLGDRWFSQFPIGGALFLAIGALFRAAWVVNPLFMGWTARNVYRFASNIGDEGFARWVGLLFAIAPFPLFLAATQLNHTPTLAFISWALSVLPTWTTSTDPRAIKRSAAIIGVAFATAAIIRPYDATLCALIVGSFQLLAVRGSRARLQSFAWQFAAGVVPIAILLYANARTTGSPLLFGYDALNGPQHRPGFHLDPKGDMHSPYRGIMFMSGYLVHLQYALFEGPLPALVLIVAGLLLARPATRWDYLLASLMAAIMLGYVAYWHDGAVLGVPRFYHTIIPAFIWFTVRGPRALSTARNGIVRRMALLAVPITLAVAWLLPKDDRLFFGVWPEAVAAHTGDGPPRADVIGDARAAGLHHALVLVRESWHGALAARERALGVPPLLTETWVANVDACALQTALDAVPPGVAGMQAIQWVWQQANAAGEAVSLSGRAGKRDSFLSLVPGRPLTPTCERELALDDVPPIPYALLLAHADFDDAGRVGGDIVYARDLGVRDTLLRARFADRAWYRYDQTPGARHGGFTPVTK